MACLLGPLDGTDSAVAVHCPGEGPAPPGAARVEVRYECQPFCYADKPQAHATSLLRNDPDLFKLSSSHPFLDQPLRPPNQSPHYRHLNGTGGRMLGLWLAPSRRGGRLRLVAMELRGMVWIGLVNSGCSRKEGRQRAEHTKWIAIHTTW